MIDLLYCAMVGAFFTHELDAMKRHEWRILPPFCYLPEALAERAFLWGHLPLFTLLLWAGDGDEDSLVRIGLASFAIIHLGLHVLFHRDERYEFNTPGSWLLVCLTAALGGIYLLVLLLR